MPRICSKCGKVMDEGYCISGGEEYYCDDKCLNETFSPEDIKEMCIGDEDSYSYWTEWEKSDTNAEVKAEEIMQKITEDSSLCLIRDLLIRHFEEEE